MARRVAASVVGLLVVFSGVPAFAALAAEATYIATLYAETEDTAGFIEENTTAGESEGIYREVESEEALEALYGALVEAGVEGASQSGWPYIERSDGSRVSWRTDSKSGGAAVDVTRIPVVGRYTIHIPKPS